MKEHNCEVCHQSKSKYKCPKCKMNYCKIGCFKNHECKLKVIEVEEEDKVIKTDFIEDEQLRLPRYKLRKLRASNKIKDFLKSGNIRKIITEIDNSKQRIKSLQVALAEPQFQELADEILKALEVVDKEGVLK